MVTFSTLLAGWLMLGPAAQAPQDAKMTQAERAELIDLLQKSEREFLEAIDRLTDEQWSFKPGPDRWSVGEVAEHLVLADAMLFDGATKMLEAEPDSKWEETLRKTDVLRNALPNRTRRVDAPGAIQPKHAMTRAEILVRYKEQRARALAFARDTSAPLKSHTSPNPFFGPLNAHQWLIYIPLHNLRHNQQIAEVKASPGYPR
jgi:uncharacterized damage-inducible protein DinB